MVTVLLESKVINELYDQLPCNYVVSHPFRLDHPCMEKALIIACIFYYCGNFVLESIYFEMTVLLKYIASTLYYRQKQQY